MLPLGEAIKALSGTEVPTMEGKHLPTEEEIEALPRLMRDYVRVLEGFPLSDYTFPEDHFKTNRQSLIRILGALPDESR